MGSSLALWASVEDLTLHPGQDDSTGTEALEIATSVLWNLTGRMYAAPQMVTEGYDTTRTLMRGAEVYPVALDGEFYNLARDCCSSCGILHRTRLSRYPIRDIRGVWVDGQQIPRAETVLLDNSVLGLTTAKACGGRCLVVQYVYGTGVPAGGGSAAIRLANELLSSWAGEACAIPERVTSVSRQGVSWGLIDPQDFLDNGRTGIYEVDLLLRTLNPARAMRRAKVFSPDVPRGHTRSYPRPPSSVDLSDGDQLVLPGTAGVWYSNSSTLRGAVTAGHVIRTDVGSQVITGPWQLNAGGLPGVTMNVDAAETMIMFDMDPIVVTDVDTASTLVTGKVRTL